MKHTLTSLGLATLLAFPTPALSATLFAADTIAGLATQITVTTSENTDLVVYPPYGEEVYMDGTESVMLPGSFTQVSGTYDVELLDRETGDTVAATSFNVLPESVSAKMSTMQTSHSYLSPDGNDEVHVSVVLRDRYGNALPGRPIELISSRSADLIEPITSETDETGEQLFAVRTYSAGDINLRAMDMLSSKLLDAQLTVRTGMQMAGMGGYAQPTANYSTYNTGYSPYQQPLQPTALYTNTYSGGRVVGNVLGRPLYGQVGSTFDIVHTFTIQAPQEMNVNEDATIRITAVDINGRRVEDYTGVVLLASTDPTALLPLNGEVQFDPQNLGEKVLTLGLRFRTPGMHILEARDSTDPNVVTQVTINVIGEETSTDPTILITSHENDGFINQNTITLEGRGAPFINIVVTGGTTDVFGETDSDGFFSLPVTLNPNQVDHTLRVRDETTRFDSGNIHLTLDIEAPEIGSITFSPEQPEEAENVTLSVESEPNLGSIIFTLNDEEYPLTENIDVPGLYELIFLAPEHGGYQPKIMAEDQAGNTTELRNTFSVHKPTLPQVQNVVAHSEVNAVSLTWDPIQSDRVDAYRIYVGETPTNFLYTLDTDRATSAATVAGLDPGVTYYFSVTALSEDRESELRSDVVEGSSLGLSLSIGQQDGALLVEWANLPNDTPLSSYLFEYGIEPDNYIEQRTISGELRAYNLRDLINGVTYFIRVTPVATTGNVLDELAALGSGTPESLTGTFNPIPGNDIPTDLIGSLHGSAADQPLPSSFHEGAPHTPTTGIPTPVWWFAFALSALLLYIHWQRRRTLRMTMQFMRQMQSTYRR